jgi:cytidine deaminase
MTECSDADRKLIAAAHAVIRRHHRPDRHEVGAAVRARGGRIFAAVNLDTRLRRASVCAEAVALGMAAAAGETEIEAVVAVNGSGQVVSPCGICREMLADYAQGASIWVPGANGPEPQPIQALLPRRYNKNGDP